MYSKAETTLPTKVYTAKAMIFPVGMYRYESWTIKKGECQTIDVFKLVVLEETAESPLDIKETKQVYPKRNKPWMFNGRSDAEAEVPIL